jgi:predicted alpha/beta superfamily hydrolase
VKNFIILFILVITLNAQAQEIRKSTASDNVFIVTDTMLIPQLNRTRAIWIYLPPDYDIEDKNYPVLYMHDGQNLFEDTTSFIGEWHVDETLDSLFADGYDVPIVVGINNGGMMRIEEFTPWVNEKYGGGKGDLYMRFIVETLKPEIDKRYRTLPEAEHSGIMGSSIGGLISFYGGLKYNSTFQKIGVFSPSFWYSDSVYTFTEHTKIAANTRIILLGSELEDSTMVPDMQKIAGLLSMKLPSGQIKVKATIYGAHSEWYWYQEFPEAVIWLMELGKE